MQAYFFYIMRLHRNLVYTTIDSLNAIFNEGEYADKVVARALKKDKRWGSSDRKFVAETIYEVVRWKRLYAEIAEVREPFNREDLWRMFAVWAVLRGYPIPDWRQLEGTPERKIKGRFDELSKIRKMRESIPDWMDELGVKELGEALWTKEIAAQNQPAKVILRVNTLKSTKENLRSLLMDLNIETEFLKDQTDALVLKERANVFLTDAFKEGLFEVQDASSQLVAAFLDVQPGMRVVDTCAGAGGKTLAIGASMRNTGRLYAMDTSAHRLDALKPRLARSQLSNVHPAAIAHERDDRVKRLAGKIDRVLVDAPCSGLGTLRRNPDLKWRQTLQSVAELQAKQFSILTAAAKLLKVGGRLVYATCSILKQENQEIIEAFLKIHPEFELLDPKVVLTAPFPRQNDLPIGASADSLFWQLWPHQHETDGFFAAILQRRPNPLDPSKVMPASDLAVSE